MTGHLQWETLQRSYLRSGVNCKEERMINHSSEYTREIVPVRVRSYAGVSRENGVKIEAVSPDEKQSSGLLKTKVSRAPMGNFYAVFSDDRHTVESHTGVNRQKGSDCSNLHEDLNVKSSLKLDYCATETGASIGSSVRSGPSSGTQKADQFISRAKSSSNSSDKGISRSMDESRHDIMDKSRDSMDKNVVNCRNNVDLLSRPGRRPEQTRNSLNYSSVRTRSRRLNVRSACNLDDQVKKSTSFNNEIELLNGSNSSGGVTMEGNRQFRRTAASVSSAKNMDGSAIDAWKDKGLKSRQELVDQSNYFSKMLKQFKDKESEREQNLERRRTLEIPRPLERVSQNVEAKVQETSQVNTHPKLTESNSSEGVLAEKEEEGNKPRFPRRKISYMDSWLQTQQSRITNLVETVKGESTDDRAPFQRSKTVDYAGVRESFNNNDQRYKPKEGLRKLASLDSDSVLESAQERRSIYKHKKFASLDLGGSRESDADSEVPPSDFSDTESCQSAYLTSDASAVTTRGIKNLSDGESSDRERKLGKSSNEGGANSGEAVNFASSSMPLVQKYAKQGHPLAVVKPFHLDSEIDLGKESEVVKTGVETVPLIPTTPTSPLLETDLDSVLGDLSKRQDLSMEMHTDLASDAEGKASPTLSRKGSITRVAVVTVQRKQFGGVLEKKTVHRGIGSASQLIDPKIDSENDELAKSRTSNTLKYNRDNTYGQEEHFGSDRDSDTRSNHSFSSEDSGVVERLGKTRFQDLRSQFDKTQNSSNERGKDMLKLHKTNNIPTEQKKEVSNVHRAEISVTFENSLDLEPSIDKLDSTKIVENISIISSPDNEKPTESEEEKEVEDTTCSIQTDKGLTELHNERLEYLNEALKPDIEDEGDEKAETASICLADIPGPSDRLSSEKYQTNNGDIISNTTAEIHGSTTSTYVHFRSRSADILRDDDRISLGSYRAPSELGYRIGHSYPGSMRGSASEEESEDEEEKLKTMSQRIRPWDPSENKAKRNDASKEESDESKDENAPRVIRRKGKGAVDRINKSLSVVMGELKELRKQDIDLAKQLLTLGKSIKEFKRHKREMEEEMLADYLFELESDQFSLDDRLSLNSYDVDYLQK